VSSAQHFSYNFPPSCPQYLGSNWTTFSANLSDFWINTEGQRYNAGSFSQTSDEDCLSLAIWAPLNITSDAKLPVIIFVPGGSFQTGGISVPYQQPVGWVERGQQHIAVTINYRVNIMGFPYAAGLEDQNPGLLDQRMAIEWVYSNIEAFGGDRDRITLWGQSAGGVAVDMLMYAFPDEPLVKGVFAQSGTAMVNVSWPDRQYRNFTYVAKNLGCDFSNDPAAELACMQKLPAVRIVNFIGNYSDHGGQPSLTFKPMPDNRTVWWNYTARAETGRIAKIPAIISTTANEETSLYKYPLSNVVAGPNQTAVDKATIDVFICLAANATDARARLGLKTYRYQYAGNFSNLTPLPWLGAYHASDIPLFMGSYEKNGPATDFQRNVAHTMQDYLFAFMVDPENGLTVKGWPPHTGTIAQGGNMLRIGASGKIAVNASASEVDNACVYGAPYNSAPQ
jgi:carboxylesterase type B